MSPFLALRSLRKSFSSARVLTEISLDLDEGRVLALLGPSGSGKTTLLRVIAGFETPDGGRVVVGGDEVTRLPPERRKFGMVFQHYALFPHLSVGENVAFGLESGSLAKSTIPGRVEEALQRVDLGGFAARRIHELSGGQQQRVALARALAPGPRLLLLDEPLSNLDPTLRERTRSELRELVRQVGITAVWVTHEQEEAFHVGDVVAVLEAGRLQQAAPPAEVYHRPANRFVAGFVGRASWLEGTAGAGIVELAGGLAWPAELAEGVGAGQPVDLLLRPEQLEIVAGTYPQALVGEIVERRFAGATTLYRIRLEDGTPVEIADSNTDRRLAERVGVAPATGVRPIAFPGERR